MTLARRSPARDPGSASRVFFPRPLRGKVTYHVVRNAVLKYRKRKEEGAMKGAGRWPTSLSQVRDGPPGRGRHPQGRLDAPEAALARGPASVAGAAWGEMPERGAALSRGGPEEHCRGPQETAWSASVPARMAAAPRSASLWGGVCAPRGRPQVPPPGPAPACSGRVPGTSVSTCEGTAILPVGPRWAERPRRRST